MIQLLFGDLLELLFGSVRINRAKYWLTFVIYPVALIALYVIFVFAFPVDVATFLVFIAFIPIIISGIAVAIKRLHDRDKSGCWLLVFYALPSALGGIGPYTGLDYVFKLAAFALSIWALVELGFLRGTSGPSQYGPDPLAVSSARPHRKPSRRNRRPAA